MNRWLILLLGLCLVFPALSPGWRGQWIWHHDDGLTDVYLRINFELTSPARQARCLVTADNRFTMFVNGQEVGYNASWAELSHYEFASHLRVGRNVIALHGEDDGEGAAGLLLDGLVWCEDDTVVPVSTDADNKISKAPADGWTEVDFDDSAWDAPAVRGPVGSDPWWVEFHRPDWFHAQGRILGSSWEGDAMPGTSGTLRMELELRGPAALQPTVALAFELGGQEVWSTQAVPDPPMAQWPQRRAFTVDFANLEIPSWAPRLGLEIRPRIPDLDLIGHGEIWIGERLPAPPLVEANVNSARINASQSVLDLDVDFVPQGALESDLLWYVALYAGEELWYADSFQPEVTTALWEANASHNIAQQVALPPLPDGDYDLRVGVHTTLRADQADATVTARGLPGRPERPYGYGTFIDKHDTPHFWYINPYGTLIWNGEPYKPVGGMYLSHWNPGRTTDEAWQRDTRDLTRLRDAGVLDMYFNPVRRAIDDPSWTWQCMLDIAQEAGVYYCWDFPMHVDPLYAWHIERSDLLVDLDERGHAQVEVPSTYFGRADPANRVLYGVFDPETNELLETGMADQAIIRDTMRASVNVAHHAGMRVKFVPELRFRGDLHDYWTGVTDRYLWEIEQMLRRMKPGPNFRGFIDPLDNEQSLRDQQRMLPASQAFRDQFALWLIDRYGTVEALGGAWALQPAPKSIAEAVGLVPLGSADPDTNDAWAVHLESGRSYRVDLTTSQMWDDMMQYRDDSIRDYNNLLADVVKSVHDAPVLMKLTELHAFTNDQTVGGFDALGLEAYSPAPELVRGSGGGVYARLVQSKRTMWGLVTETGFAFTELAPIGYPDPLRLIHELTSMVEYGARGVYYFVFIPDGGWTGHNMFEDPRQLAWLGAYNEIVRNAVDLDTHRPWVDFSFPQKQVGPQAFRRVEPDFDGTPPHVAIATNNGRWVVPVVDLPGIDPVKSNARLIVNLERPPKSVRHAQDLDDAIAAQWPIVMVGLRHDLGTLSVDKHYTDNFATDSDGRAVQIVSPPRGATVTHKLPDGRPFGFQTEMLSVIAKDGWDHVVRSLDGEPATSDPDDFTQRVLNADFVDLGPAFQAIQTGNALYLWNLNDEPATIELECDSPMQVAVVDGDERVEGVTSHRLTLAPTANQTVRVESETRVRVRQTEDANLAHVSERWQALAERAAALEVSDFPAMPDGGWEPIHEALTHWEPRITDQGRTALVARAPGEIAIDGNLDDWEGIEPIRINKRRGIDFVEEIPTLDGTGVYLAYDDDGLYVAVRVKDERVVNNHRGRNLWNGDAFELFLETRLQPGRTDRAYDADCFHFVFAPTSADGVPAMGLFGHPEWPAGEPVPEVNWTAKVDDMGWTLEIHLPPDALYGYAPSEGDTLGFSFILNDADAGNREHQYPWQNRTNMHDDRLSFGRAQLMP